MKALLDGPAATTIQGLSLSEANYTAAVELIKERYDNTAHMDELIKTPACSGDKAAQIRAVYDKINVHVRGLDSLGIGTGQYGSVLVPVIMEKLPQDVRLQIARVTTRDVWDIEELMQVIKSEVEAREMTEGIKINETRKLDNLSRKSAMPTTSSFLTKDGGSNERRCIYCKADHYSASCSKIGEPTRRKEVLKKEGRCFLCLSIGHCANDCGSHRRCRRCGKRHHQSLCETASIRPDKSTEVSPDNSG